MPTIDTLSIEELTELGALTVPFYDVVKQIKILDDTSWDVAHRHLIMSAFTSEREANQYADECNQCRASYEWDKVRFIVEEHYNDFVGRAYERRDCPDCPCRG